MERQILALFCQFTKSICVCFESLTRNLHSLGVNRIIGCQMQTTLGLFNHVKLVAIFEVEPCQ